jgi:hypothetical protein
VKKQFLLVWCLLVLTSEIGGLAYAQTSSATVTNVQLISITEGGTCVMATVTLQGWMAEGAHVSDACFEFIFPPQVSAALVEFSAHRMDAAPIGSVTLTELPWIAGWEITPADYLNGVGGYARLFLPSEVVAGPQGSTSVTFAVYTTYLSPVELLAAVSQGTLTWSETTSE